MLVFTEHYTIYLSIHSMQPDDYYKTELMSEANRHKISL